MGFKAIPAIWEYICDGCGFEISGDVEHKNFCPPRWSWLTMRHHDFKDGITHKLLCPGCGARAMEGFTKLFVEAKDAKIQEAAG